MIRLRLFASIKELTSSNEEFFPYEGFNTVGSLKKILSLRGQNWNQAFNSESVIKAAVNKELVSDDFPINDLDEVAFFPPVTGG